MAGLVRPLLMCSKGLCSRGILEEIQNFEVGFNIVNGGNAPEANEERPLIKLYVSSVLLCFVTSVRFQLEHK